MAASVTVILMSVSRTQVLFELLTGQSAQCDVDDEGTDLVSRALSKSWLNMTAIQVVTFGPHFLFAGDLY